MNAISPIGELRHRLTLEMPVNTADDIGGFRQTWLSVAEVWAAIDTRSANEQFEAQRRESSFTHRITIRWRPDVNGAMRLSGDGKAYRILAVHDADHRRRYLTCLCEETGP